MAESRRQSRRLTLSWEIHKDFRRDAQPLLPFARRVAPLPSSRWEPWLLACLRACAPLGCHGISESCQSHPPGSHIASVVHEVAPTQPRSGAAVCPVSVQCCVCAKVWCAVCRAAHAIGQRGNIVKTIRRCIVAVAFFGHQGGKEGCAGLSGRLEIPLLPLRKPSDARSRAQLSLTSYATPHLLGRRNGDQYRERAGRPGGRPTNLGRGISTCSDLLVFSAQRTQHQPLTLGCSGRGDPWAFQDVASMRSLGPGFPSL